jgi:hydroxylamine reductase (hybrid-cluster protein)
VVLGHPFHVSGSDNVNKFLSEETMDRFGASFHVCETPEKAFEAIMLLLDSARKKLGIDTKAQRKLFDMSDRRKQNV